MGPWTTGWSPANGVVMCHSVVLRDLEAPPCMLIVSFGLVPITLENGPIEIAPGTHRMPRKDALRAIGAAEIAMQAVPWYAGDSRDVNSIPRVVWASLTPAQQRVLRFPLAN